MKEREKRVCFIALKLLYIFTIFCSALALKLEIGVFCGNIPREQVDALFMLDAIVASVFILGGASFLFFKYL